MRSKSHVLIGSRATAMAAWALVGLALVLGRGQLCADTIRFKDGVAINGVVVKETATYVRVRLRGSGVTIQYGKDEIAEIVPEHRTTENAFRLFRTGRFDEALEVFQNIASDDLCKESHEMAWLGLSQLYLAKGMYPQAVGSYLWLLRTDPNTRLYPYLPLPEIKLAGERPHASILSQVVKDAREDTLEHPFIRHVTSLLLALDHISARSFSEAEALLNVAQQNPDRRIAHLATVVRAYGLYCEDHLDRAQALLEGAAWTHDMAVLPVLDYWLGRVAYERKDFRRAAAAMMRAVIMYELPSPTMKASALLSAGQSFESLRQFDRAMQVYDCLSENCGQLAQARRARQRLVVIRDEVGNGLTVAPSSRPRERRAGR